MLKVMPWPWLSVSKQIWIKSFIWGTVFSCRSRDFKNIKGQSWRSIRNCYSARFEIDAPSVRLLRQIFSDLQLWPLIFLQPLNLQECTVSHLKDLIPIYLENESQGHSMTFNMGYLCSKYPYFISYIGLCWNRSWLHCTDPRKEILGCKFAVICKRWNQF